MNCPICGEEMVLRNGPKVTFYGCKNYARTRCTGKRDIDGTAWGCDEEPGHLDEQGSMMFRACLSDGFSYEEATSIAEDWQRQEENDHWK